MNKFTCLTLTCLALSGSALADSFSTTAEVSRRVAQLTVIEKKPLILPEVSIDQSLSNGEILCSTTHFGSFKGKHYCTGKRRNGVYEIVGTPFSNVTIQLPLGTLIKNGLGLQLSIVDGTTQGRVLDKKGKLTFEVAGTLSLVNKSQSISTNQVFDFEVTAVYD